MENKSPFELVKDLQGQLATLVSAFDIESLNPAERETLKSLKRQVTDVRLDMRDYGLAETAVEQQRLGRTARRGLEQLEKRIVEAGLLGLFGPADVAQTSAIIQQLMAEV